MLIGGNYNCQFCGRFGTHDCQVAQTPETLRDRLALGALQTLQKGDPDGMATDAYRIADAMLRAREPSAIKPVPKKAG
jgi:hypothetical protein